ncbi:MAG: RHS repeat-associated core domain-containing protein, partial [Treponema sp.]|nr:RHS repeat-associated core domain-containing protein [Treponema sp.]
SKHIFVGDTRIATKSSYDDTGTNYGFEEKHQYWHHGDHLGSAQLITNYQGLLHERIEYAPYGELWIEHRYEADSFALPYLFTGKELDPETNLYYYGARYLDPKRSRWISGDPAMGEYIPGAPVNDEARKRNQDLPGMGGVFNIVNLHTYHYAGNNPVRITDPTGRDDVLMTDELQKKIDNYFEQNAKSQSLLTDISSALISEILGFDVNGQPTVGESMAGVANMLSTFTGAMSYIAESEELIAGASKSLGGFSSIVGWLSTGPNVYTAFTDRSVDSVSNAAGSIAGVAFNFPLGIIAGPSTKVITKAVGETAIAGAKLNNTLKHEPIKVFQAMFNFAVRFR